MKRSRVNGCIEVDRLVSGIQVSDSFQMFALTVGGDVLGGEGNCPRCIPANCIAVDNSLKRPMSTSFVRWGRHTD